MNAENQEVLEMLYTPSRQNWYCRVNVTAHHDVVSFIKKNLRHSVVEKLKETMFGHFFRAPLLIVCSRLLHKLVKCELHQPDQNIIKLNVGGAVLTFRLEDFIVISGLPADGKVLAKKSGMTEEALALCSKYFPNHPKSINQNDMEQLLKIREGSRHAVEDEDDCFILALVYFASYYVLGCDPVNRIPLPVWNCIVSGRYKKLAWGRMSYKELIKSLKKNGGTPSSYKLKGCPAIYQIWFMEVCGACEGFLATRKVHNDHLFRPRIYNWLMMEGTDMPTRREIETTIFEKDARELNIVPFEPTEDERSRFLRRGLGNEPAEFEEAGQVILSPNNHKRKRKQLDVGKETGSDPDPVMPKRSEGKKAKRIQINEQAANEVPKGKKKNMSCEHSNEKAKRDRAIPSGGEIITTPNTTLNPNPTPTSDPSQKTKTYHDLLENANDITTKSEPIEVNASDRETITTAADVLSFQGANGEVYTLSDPPKEPDLILVTAPHVIEPSVVCVKNGLIKFIMGADPNDVGHIITQANSIFAFLQGMNADYGSFYNSIRAYIQDCLTWYAAEKGLKKCKASEKLVSGYDQLLHQSNEKKKDVSVLLDDSVKAKEMLEKLELEVEERKKDLRNLEARRAEKMKEIATLDVDLKASASSAEAARRLIQDNTARQEKARTSMEKARNQLKNYLM